MIRVLEVIASMNRGGVETTLMNIFRTINRNEVILDFLLTTDRECDYNEEIRRLGGEIYSIPNRKYGLKKNKDALYEFFRIHKEYNIIHMHVASLTYIEPLKAAQSAGIPVRIIHARNTRQNGCKIHILLHYYHQLQIKNIATSYFTCSDLASKWMYGNRIDPTKIKMINNGIIADKFIFDNNIRKRVRNDLALKENELAIVNVGRFAKQKNHIFLLNVFKEVKRIVPTAKLFLIGEGPNRKKIQAKIASLNLGNSVILTGVRNDICDILQGMDLFLMPSLYEGLPGSIVEAQGSSLPCLLSDTITKEVALTNLVSYKSLKESSKVWAEKTIELVNRSQRRNTKKEIVDSGFDMYTIAKRLEQFYIDMDVKAR